MAIAINLIVVCLALSCPRNVDPVLDQLKPSRYMQPRPWHLVAVLPVLAVAGVERLNDGHGSALVQFAIGAVIISLIIGFVQAWRGRHVRAQVFLFCASLALLYLYSYRGNHLFGYDIQQEYQRFSGTFSAARWVPPSDGDPYTAMLSITALPTALAKLTSISGLYLFKGLYPIFLAFVPGLIYELAAHWLPGRAAFIGAAYMVVLPDFSSQLPALARQETGFLFFALLVVALFAPELRGRPRQMVIAVLLAGLVVSHYTTSYVAVALLGSTWLFYALFRALARLRHRKPARPRVGIVTVALGVSMVLAWDVWITNSSANVTKFMSSLTDDGLQLLPYAKGSILNSYLKGNVGAAITPSGYYAQAEQTSRASQPWLHPFPAALTSHYPAQYAPSPLLLHALVPGSGSATSGVVTTLDELILVLIGLGVALCFLKRRRPPRVPLEVAALCLAFLGFLALIRFSGTVAGSYNSDRAQLQGAIILVVALGLAAEAIMARFRLGPAVLVAALLVILVNSIGETSIVTGGGAPVLLANGGPGYDYFVISDGEVSAARWLVANGGPNPLIYTDEYGPLRIWDATSDASSPQTLLTPATVAPLAWVYAAAYSVVDGRAYGGSVTYAFPAKFLGAVDNLVYSDPTARVYQ